MTLGVIGWAVVHSLWQWTLIAGLTAMVLGLLRDPRARTRYVIACAGLALMVMTSFGTALTGDAVDPALRHRILYALDGAMMLPPIVPVGFFILRAAAVLWLAGCVIGILRLAHEWRRARRLRRDSLTDVDADVRAIVADLRARMRIDAVVEVRYSTQASVPMLLGFRRPLILLPEPTASRLTREQLQAILAHELGHVRRADYLTNVIQIVADLIVFHHPAARWLSRRIRTEREYCCDDVAVNIANDVSVYARALAALEDARGDCRFAVAAASGTLLDRIQRIAGHPRPTLTAARGAIAFAVALVLAAALLAVTINVPPPGVPAGVQMRRPGPAGAALAPPGGRQLPRTPPR